MYNRIHSIIDNLALCLALFLLMYMALLFGAMICIYSGNIASLIMPAIMDVMGAYAIAFKFMTDYEKAKEEDLAE